MRCNISLFHSVTRWVFFSPETVLSDAQSFLLTHFPSQRMWMLPSPARRHEQSCSSQMGHHVGQCLGTKPVKEKPLGTLKAGRRLDWSMFYHWHLCTNFGTVELHNRLWIYPSESTVDTELFFVVLQLEQNPYTWVWLDGERQNREW